MKVNVQATHDSKMELEIEPSVQILELKKRISDLENEAKQTNLLPENIRLIFAGRILKDTETVQECNIKEGNTIHMVKSQQKKSSLFAPVQQEPKSDPANSVPQNASDPALPDLSSILGGGNLEGLSGLGADPFANLNDPAMQEATMQMMENPEIRRQMVDMVAANPDLLRTAMQMNPMFNQMPPEMQRLMLNPDMIRLMMETSSSMRNAQATSPSTAPNPLAAGLPPNIQDLVQALQGGSIPQPPTSSEPPEERFSSQLQQLQDMGFYDKDENIRALLLTNGNVNAAVERLLSNNF